MDTGILFNGMYLGSVSRQRQDGRQSFVVAVACGLRSYEITMRDWYDFSNKRLMILLLLPCPRCAILMIVKLLSS